jgi:serine acetyltransferase
MPRSTEGRSPTRFYDEVCVALSDVSIGEHVVIEPGLYLPHGYVVIDGNVTIERGTTIAPWVAIGLRDGHVMGPRVGRRVFIGTGAKVLGEVKIGRLAKISTNAAVLRDVPEGATVGGVPARVLAQRDLKAKIARNRQAKKSAAANKDPSPDGKRTNGKG